MVTEEQVELARKHKAEAESTINQYHKERMERFDERMKTNPIFTDEELIYSQSILCPCGHGLAYPKGCGPFHYWDCSAILKGIANKTVTHTGQLPFSFYEIKSEQQPGGGTTRGVFRPKSS